MRIINKIEPKVPQMPTRKKVAAYARVSMESERLQHSLSAQVSFYSDLIQKHPGWEYAGVYADNGISGTKTTSREEFMRMLADCEAGKIDIILTKSISRFARNTVDLLETVRHLKDLGISVQFEKERIDSMSEDGELMLTLLASFAQEESRSISENVKWGTIQRFKEGIPNGQFTIFGYKWVDDKLVIIPEEAEIVRFMYSEYLKGASRIEIGRALMERGIYTRKGCPWVDSNVKVILTNITYTGNMLFHKEYCLDPITKKRKKNRGELPQYFVEGTHEAIISMEEWQAVQEEFKRRRDLGVFGNKSLNLSCFTGKIKCGHCGQSFVRNTRRRRLKGVPVEQCDKYTTYGCGTQKKKGRSCPARDIPEETLKAKCAEVLGLDEFDEETFSAQVEKIIVPEHLVLEFYMTDGRVIRTEWVSTAKKDAWTAERRAAKGKLVQERQITANSSCFTSRIRCEMCGENYRRQRSKRVDGSFVNMWRCSSSARCKSQSLPEPTLHELAATAMGFAEFSEDAFRQQIQYISIVDKGRLVFHFFDGRDIEAEWKNKRTMPPHSEERKAEMSRKMKENWRKRRGESNDHSGNDQPVHSDTD